MGISREFRVSCDKCGKSCFAGPSATQMRGICKNDGWSISGNKFTCPACNGRLPDYWNNDGGKSESDQQN